MESSMPFRSRMWQEAYALSLIINEVIRAFPHDERFELVSQMRRAATSISALIAEGYGKRTRRDYINYLYMARGSANEMMNHCMLAKDLGYIPSEKAASLMNRYRGLSAGILSAIKTLEKKK